MTTASAAGDDAEPRTPRLMWLAHYINRYQPFSSVMLTSSVIAILWLPRQSTAARTTVIIPVLVLVAAILIRRKYHDRSLCPLEFEEAPLDDPQGEIDRNMPKLDRYHSGWHFRLMLAGDNIAALIAITVIGRHRNLAVLLPATAVILAGMAVNIYAVRVLVVHARLRPYCPHCRRHRGDDDITVPTPTPDPVGTAPTPH